MIEIEERYLWAVTLCAIGTVAFVMSLLPVLVWWGVLSPWVLAIATAIVILVFWRMDSPYDPATDQFPAGFHTRGGERLHTARYGISSCSAPAPRVLLLHGMLASHRFWEPMIERLTASGMSCIAPDLLGFGRSPWPGGSSQYSMASHCSWLARDAVPPGPVHIVGHSLGAVVALVLAASLPPGQVLSLTLIGMPWYQNSAEAKEQVLWGHRHYGLRMLC